MGSITVSGVGKAYKFYPSRWARLAEWLSPFHKRRHTLKWVLQDINVSIGQGESVGVLGVNGAGKSTLLKMITGTTQPTTGSISIQGRMAALLELGMGFHPDFTGRQNVFMAGQLLGYQADEISELMPEIEAFAEIGDYIDQPVRVYSSGMQVRLAFSVATMKKPDILIVDEALSVGDAYFQAKCFQRINHFRQNGTTLLLVSHSPGDVVKHCDRAILLKGGRVAMDSSSREVTNRYLDELFGKPEAATVDAEASIPTDNTAAHGLSQHDDVFHSRPGYHASEHRWGHGGASIIDFLVSTPNDSYPSRIESNTHTEFYFTVRFDSDFDEVVPGFLLKTLEGIFLYGTNSYLSSRGTAHHSAQAGSVHTYRFSMPMALNEGHYLVSFGISSGDPKQDLVPLDRRYDSVLIHVGRDVQFWGIADLHATYQQLNA
jgi:lipopolysaccharide transport system ATP-binding protein